jgi:hypothetical protein
MEADALANELDRLAEHAARAVLREAVTSELAADRTDGDTLWTIPDLLAVAGPVAAVALAVRQAVGDPEIVWVDEDLDALRMALRDLAAGHLERLA